MKYLVLPGTLLETFSRTKFAVDVHTTVVTQGASEIYLQSGMYEDHIHKLRRQYKRKGTLLKKGYLAHLPEEAEFTGGESGFYSTIILPERIKGMQLVDHLKHKNVLLQDTTAMYLKISERKRSSTKCVTG